MNHFNEIEFSVLVELTITGISDVYIERVLKFVASELENTRHIHFYLIWINAILTRQGTKINSTTQMPVLLTLQKNMQRKYDELSKMYVFNNFKSTLMTILTPKLFNFSCDFNQYTIKYIQRLGEHKAAKEVNDIEDSSDEESQIVEEMDVD